MRRARAIAVRLAVSALAAAALAWALTALIAIYVGGDSMSPALVRGDLAVVRRSLGQVRAGDVILIAKPGWPSGVLHRVTAVTLDGRFQTRGDANPVPDLDPVPRSSVLGVLAFAIPTGRVMAVLDMLARMVQSRVT
jgi:signal peptidase